MPEGHLQLIESSAVGPLTGSDAINTCSDWRPGCCLAKRPERLPWPDLEQNDGRIKEMANAVGEAYRLP